jgi:hypothetical protein
MDYPTSSSLVEPDALMSSRWLGRPPGVPRRAGSSPLAAIGEHADPGVTPDRTCRGTKRRFPDSGVEDSSTCAG